MKEKTAQVEQTLKTSFPEQWEVPDLLSESMMYSLMAGGKRLRPLLVLIATESLGQSEEIAIPVACAVEMIHTYSLIHDDLPAMDNDDFRRGKPTNHKVFGDAIAILAGDALLTHAFYMITQMRQYHQISAEHTLSLIEECAIYAGAQGLVGGQVADIRAEQGVTHINELDYIHIHKTSDLIVFSLRAGGRIGGATPKQLEAFTTFGQCLGLAFQIQDDILDLVGDEVKLGKPIKSDEQNQKVTYPYLIGLDASKQKINQLTNQAKQAIEQANLVDTKRLFELADYLMKREY
jgi:geranylgeranyl diphosphate synthase type II